MKYIQYFMVISLFCVILSGCDYISPFQALSKASELNDSGEYSSAIPHYEEAISGFSKRSMLKVFEYETRYSYALMLNEYTKDNNPEYIKVARANYEWILTYLEENDELFSTKGMVLSSMANTYQQEAAYTESEGEYFLLLEKAYSIYKESAQELKNNKDWHNLAYTYYNLGETSEWYGDLDEAIKWLRLAVELDKKHGFQKDLIEDEEYLNRLIAEKQEMLNKSIRPTAEASAD